MSKAIVLQLCVAALLVSSKAVAQTAVRVTGRTTICAGIYQNRWDKTELVITGPENHLVALLMDAVPKVNLRGEIIDESSNRIKGGIITCRYSTGGQAPARVRNWKNRYR